MSKLRVFECFAGVGSQRMALRNLGIEHEVVGISEIDKHALISYNAIHGDCPNFGDISKIEPSELPDMDLFTYSFPCQDLSVAGRQQGLGDGTRSGLLYECEKIIETKKPKYLLLENVKNLVGKKFKGDFDEWLAYLKGLGYTNYWKVLNAKDYGVPQNRERVFVVSILNCNQVFTFPKPIQLEKRLIDVLEDSVDGEYYVDSEKLIKISNWNSFQNPLEKVYGHSSISPTLTARGAGEYHSGMVLYNELQEKDYVNYRQELGNGAIETEPNFRIRRLTPLECWRLMSFTDEDFYKAKNAGVSDSQLYKQAGNSIVVKVLEGIFTNMFIEKNYKTATNTLFDDVFKNLK